MTEATDVIVIGAGHNGLTCASVLAKSGLRVTVLESRDEVGGMSSTCTLQGSYRFPGLANTAFPISPIVSRALDLDRHGYTPGSPASTISLQEDGRHLSIGPDGSELAGVDDADQTAYTNLIEDFRSWAEALEPLMLNKPPRLKNMDAADKRTFAKLGWNVRIGLGKASMYEFLRIAAINIYDVLNENLDDERLKGAIAADAVFGHNMGPRTPGTVLTCLLHQFNARSGARCVVAGDGSQLVEALRRSAESHGAEVKFGSTVKKILVGDGRACGVELSDGTTLLAKRIASSADARTTFLKHIGAAELDAMFTNRVNQIRGEGNVAKLHVALSGVPEFGIPHEDPIRHRLLISPSMRFLEQAFNCSKYAEISAEPPLEITFPSAYNDALAPPGHHVMSVSIAYAPYRLERGWESERAPLTERVISRIARFAPNLPELVVDHQLLTPVDIEREFKVVGGHWHHGEMTIHQSFMMRPLYGAAQYDTPVYHLFLCGAGCHPGGGLTGLPGYLAARRMLEMHR